MGAKDEVEPYNVSNLYQRARFQYLALTSALVLDCCLLPMCLVKQSGWLKLLDPCHSNGSPGLSCQLLASA